MIGPRQAVAHAVVAAVVAIGWAPAAQAGTNEVYAAVDAAAVVTTHTDGTPVIASVVGAGPAYAEGTTTSFHIRAFDAVHYAIGAPTSGGSNDSYFQVIGGAGPVTLKISFQDTRRIHSGRPAYFCRTRRFHRAHQFFHG